MYLCKLESDFHKNLTEFHQISPKNLKNLTDFCQQLMACMYPLQLCHWTAFAKIRNKKNVIVKNLAKKKYKKKIKFTRFTTPSC